MPGVGWGGVEYSLIWAIHTYIFYFIWCVIHRTSTLFQINLQFDNFLTLTDG